MIKPSNQNMIRELVEEKATQYLKAGNGRTAAF